MNPVSKSIKWADYTWNPIVGCSHFSAGCDNCWAKAQHDMRHKAWMAGKKVPKSYMHPFSTIRFYPERLSEIVRPRSKPARIFVCSVSDFWHIGVREEWRQKVIETIFRNSLLHDKFLFLTKRPHLIRGQAWLLHPNIWVGTSIENANSLGRVWAIVGSPVENKFLSVEPMLGPFPTGTEISKIKWVICGRETGRNARPFRFEWARDLHRRCRAYGVPFFFKNNEEMGEKYGRLPEEFPEGLKL